MVTIRLSQEAESDDDSEESIKIRKEVHQATSEDLKKYEEKIFWNQVNKN